MTDNPTGAAAAANEIIDAYNLEALTETIEAIILKHCPEDGVVRRLVYLSKIILEDLRYIFNTPGDKPDELPVAVLARNIARFESIIAVAEKTSSQPDVIPEDKAVEKLVEALIEARVTLGFPVGTQQPNGFFSIEYHAVADTVKIIDDALADYKDVNK